MRALLITDTEQQSLGSLGSLATATAQLNKRREGALNTRFHNHTARRTRQQNTQKQDDGRLLGYVLTPRHNNRHQLTGEWKLWSALLNSFSSIDDSDGKISELQSPSPPSSTLMSPLSWFPLNYSNVPSTSQLSCLSHKSFSSNFNTFFFSNWYSVNYRSLTEWLSSLIQLVSKSDADYIIFSFLFRVFILRCPTDVKTLY